MARSKASSGTRSPKGSGKKPQKPPARKKRTGSARRSQKKENSPSRKPSKSKQPSRTRPRKKPTPRKAVPKGRVRRTGLGTRIKRLLIVGFLLGSLALCIDVLLLSEAVSERMEGRIHDQPARITGLVPRLAVGEYAQAEGWRSTLKILGLTEASRAEEVGAGSFHLGPRFWLIHPRGQEPVRARVARGKVKWLRSSTSNVPLPSIDFPMPAVSVLTGSQRQRRSVVPIEDIPLSLIRAVVAIEDERFYRHHGIDPRGIGRALLANFRAGGISQGGSTITQQLAKNMFLRADRTLRRKFQEALLSLILEYRYSKDEILEAYLNEIYLGQRSGYAIMGVGEAAAVWYGKDVSSLSTGEAALIAGAIHSPNRTVPWKHPEEAARRRDQVIKKMRSLKALPSSDLDAASSEGINSTPGAKLQRRAPWFVDSAVADLRKRYTPEALHREGLELVTTLDLRMQAAAEAAVSKGLEHLRQQRPDLWSSNRHPEVALVALDPSTGAIRALVGGSDYRRSQFNRVTQARRQPGSAFKPIVLAAAIGAQWPKLGPRSLVRDAALEVPLRNSEKKKWSPKNYDNQFLGPITLRQATYRSRNLPFVRLAVDLGIGRIRSAAQAMGITSPIPAVPSIAIGSAEVSPLELATVYATLANGGMKPSPHYLVGVQSAEGEWLERDLPANTAAIDPRVAAVVTDLLEGVVDEGTGRGARREGIKIPLAGKTGTSNDGRDAWMAGYTPDLSAVVWVGFDEAEPMGLSSTQAALPIWTEFMKRAEPYLRGEDFEIPMGTRRVLAGGPPLLDPQRRLNLENEDRARRAMEAEEARRQTP